MSAVHGSLQQARIKASALRYRILRDGDQWCAVFICRTGRSVVGTFADEEEAQAWLMDKLPRPARTKGDLIRG